MGCRITSADFFQQIKPEGPLNLLQ